MELDRRISAARPENAARTPAKTAAKSGLFVALVHETLNAQAFESVGDLAEEVKCRCARLRIRYDSRQVWEALDFVERLRPLVKTPRKVGNEPDEPPSLSREEAAAFLAELKRRLGDVRVRTVSPAQ